MRPGLKAFAPAAWTLALLLGSPAAAQDFSAAIVVNDRAVSVWEVEQRILLLDAFGTPGDLPSLAREQLVEDRLKTQELERIGVSLTDEGRARALEDFAARADLSAEEFAQRLGAQGIAPETLRDYVETNVAWRDYIRARFGEQVEVTEEEVEQALAQEGAGSQGIEVLLSEIILPAPPGEEAAALALAERLSRIGSTGEFEAAAREVSAVPSREQGGRLDWTPLSNYPAPLQEILLNLAPGEVTPPLPLTGAVALIQLRDLREAAVSPVGPEIVDYALVRIAGGASAAAQTEAARIAAEAETCTDLFGQGIPDANITREEVAPAALPEAVALDLARLDPNEVTWGRVEGGALILTMLCSRTYPLPEGVPDREAVADAIRSQRLEGYSDVILADLRAAATIVGE